MKKNICHREGKKWSGKKLITCIACLATFLVLTRHQPCTSFLFFSLILCWLVTSVPCSSSKPYSSTHHLLSITSHSSFPSLTHHPSLTTKVLTISFPYRPFSFISLPTQPIFSLNFLLLPISLFIHFLSSLLTPSPSPPLLFPRSLFTHSAFPSLQYCVSSAHYCVSPLQYLLPMDRRAPSAPRHTRGLAKLTRLKVIRAAPVPLKPRPSSGGSYARDTR